MLRENSDDPPSSMRTLVVWNKPEIQVCSPYFALWQLELKQWIENSSGQLVQLQSRLCGYLENPTVNHSVELLRSFMQRSDTQLTWLWDCLRTVCERLFPLCQSLVQNCDQQKLTVDSLSHTLQSLFTVEQQSRDNLTQSFQWCEQEFGSFREQVVDLQERI